MHSLVQDLRQSARLLLKQPGFSAMVIVTLALGIGANTAIFSVINALILSPPEFADAGRVAALWRTPKDRRVEDRISYLELQEWQRRSRAFESIAGYKTQSFVIQGEDRAESVPGLRVTSNFLSLLRTQVIRGRDFHAEDEKRNAVPVVLVGHSFWKDRLNGDEAALGRELTLNGRAFTVIGILPPSFRFPIAPDSDALITTVAGEGRNLEERGAQVLRAIGRLASGVSPEQAQAEFRGISASLEREFPQHNRDAAAIVVPVDEHIVGPSIRQALWLLLGAVGLLLLIACTNVTNLLLARSAVRQRELAIRAALGAGGWRLARLLFTEGLLLSAAAGAAGLLLGTWSMAAIQIYGGSQLPRLTELQVDARVLAFTALVSLVTALVFSILPMVRASRPHVHDVLKSGAGTASSGVGSRLWQDSLVVAEVAVGLVLFLGAGLMIRSFNQLVNVDPGFDPRNVLMGRISLTRPAYADSAERARFIQQTLDRLRALPGVESAALIAPMPFSGGNVSGDFRIEGAPEPRPGSEPMAAIRSVTPEYFAAIRIPLRSGRYFTPADRRGAPGVAIINEALARQYFPKENPVGRRISNIGANQNQGDPETWEIAGVVGDVRHGSLTAPAEPEIYLPFEQNTWNWGNFLIRSSGDPAALSRAFAEAIRAGDKTVLITKVQPLPEAIADSVSRSRFYTFLFALFGAIAIVLTLSGIYGVISYTVSRQTREIGIRVALGARSETVFRLVAGRGLLLTLAGVALGLVGSLAVSRFMESLLFRVRGTDPPTFAAVSIVLLAVGFAASAVPAMRAARVDPIVALRAE
ncbi:MAG: ABC transporter permease [Bryobacteraceae bacterium]|nr:ABC transporter permease [Bryobacteraceae bacterium]